MQVKKFLFLFLGLLLPILVFVFLKFFGKNEFDVQPLHQGKIENINNECEIKYSVPYTVHDSVFQLLDINKSANLILIDLSGVGRTVKELVAPYGEGVQFIENSKLRELKNSKFIQECVLLTPAAISHVLLDQKGQIRGYYNESDRDELDRLDAELKIILKKY